jgi:hypothetical protein
MSPQFARQLRFNLHQQAYSRRLWQELDAEGLLAAGAFGVQAEL